MLTYDHQAINAEIEQRIANKKGPFAAVYYSYSTIYIQDGMHTPQAAGVHLDEGEARNELAGVGIYDIDNHKWVAQKINPEGDGYAGPYPDWPDAVKEAL